MNELYNIICIIFGNLEYTEHFIYILLQISDCIYIVYVHIYRTYVGDPCD